MENINCVEEFVLRLLLDFCNKYKFILDVKERKR